jgi:DNA-binding NarL/FixJ family response regulator
MGFYPFLLADFEDKVINEPLDPCECRRQASEQMSSSAKIVLARKDLSIPGAPGKFPATRNRSDIEAHFFQLVDENDPDVIVLDCDGSPAATETILKVRWRTDVPIIVLCQPVDELIEQYCGAGAAECISSPVELAALHRSIERIISGRRQQARATARRA